MLEEEVDEKYYLSKQMLIYAFNLEKEAKGIGFSDGVDKSYINPDIELTIGCRSASGQRSGTSNYVSDDKIKRNVADIKNTNLKIIKEPKLIQVAQMYGTEKEPNPQAGRIYSADGISPTMDTCSGGNRMPKVLIENNQNKE